MKQSLLISALILTACHTPVEQAANDCVALNGQPYQSCFNASLAYHQQAHQQANENLFTLGLHMMAGQ